MRRIALTRDVPDSIARCELTHVPRQPIDIARARAQHADYEVALRRTGCRVERVPAAPDCPDSVFIEDTAVVLAEVAILTRPGAASRRAETDAVADALAAYRGVCSIQPPGTVDGGDVLALGRRIYIALSGRTNAEGIRQMRAHTSPYGYVIESVPVHACLHLKSAATSLSDRAVLVQPRWIDPRVFRRHEVVTVDPTEPYGANALRVGDRIIYPSAFPRTAERIASRGLEVLTVDASELAKAEGAVTCCSLVFEDRPRP